MTHNELLAMHPGEQIQVGKLFANLCEDEITLLLTEKVDGIPQFDAFYLGVKLGVVVYDKGVWGWGQ